MAISPGPLAQGVPPPWTRRKGLKGGRPIALRVARPRLLEQQLPQDEGVGGQRGRMGKGPEPVPIT
jgi:hypothetical protein